MFRREVRVGQRRAHARRIAVLDGREAGAARGARVPLPVRCQLLHVFEHGVGGVGAAGGPVVDAPGLAAVVAEAEAQVRSSGQGEAVLHRDRGGDVAVVLGRRVAVAVAVPVVLVVDGQLQFVALKRGAGQGHRAADGAVVVDAGEAAVVQPGCVAAVGIGLQAVAVGVAVHAGAQRGVPAQPGVADEVQAVLVPPRPAPVADAAARAAGIDRIALLPVLAGVAQGVLVALARGVAELERQPAVVAIGVAAVVAGIGGHALVVAETIGQRERVRLQLRPAELVVPVAPAAA